MYNHKVLKRKLFGLASVLILAVAVVLGLNLDVRAESGQAFSISPSLLDLKADPGQTLNVAIKFTNISSGNLQITSQVNDFTAKDENGDPNIILDDSTSTPFSLKNWISSQAPFIVASKQSKTANFSIQVPKNAEPGGHYAVIRFSGNAPGAAENNVAISASIGALVLLRVSGNIQEQASLASFFSATPQLNKSQFFENGPINFVERINNTGNIHIKPTGTLDVFDMFGNKISSLRVNGDPADYKNVPRNVLPKSIRMFSQKLPNQWLFGRYTAKLSLTYGQSNQQITSVITFWVVPYKLIVGVVIGLVALFLLLRFAIKRYNHYIVSKSNSSGKSKK